MVVGNLDMAQSMVGTESPDRAREEGLSRDVVFTMLSNQRRRHVIHHLKRTGESASLRDLSRQVGAWENGVDPDELTYKQRKRVYTSLHQSHLPKLADAGVVDYNRDRGTVELGDAASELDVYMEVVPEGEIPWSSYYLGLAGLSLATVVVAALEVFPFSVLPDLGYAALVAVAVALSAAVQAYSDRRSRLARWTDPPGVTETPSPAVVVSGAADADPADD